MSPGDLLSRDTWVLLQNDPPEKRRKAYFELAPNEKERLLTDLSRVGFELPTLKWHGFPFQNQLVCTVMGNTQAIRLFLKNASHVCLMRVDFPEFTWTNLSQE